MKPAQKTPKTTAPAALALLTTAFVVFSCPVVLSAADTSALVRETGVMTVGVRGDFPPFSEAVGEGEDPAFTGFDIDIARAVAERIGVKPEFVVVEPGLLVPMTAESMVQAAPGICHRMSLERVIDFSVTYLVGGVRAMVVSSSGIYRLSSLNSRTVAVVAGTDETEIEKKLPRARIVRVDTPAAGLDLLTRREAIALVGDFSDLVNLVTTHERPSSLRILDEPIMMAPIAIGLPPDDGQWRQLVDSALMDLWSSGTYAEIYETWFGRKAKVRLPLEFTMEVWPK